jgi:hypothetical protein
VVSRERARRWRNGETIRARSCRPLGDI